MTPALSFNSSELHEFTPAFCIYVDTPKGAMPSERLRAGYPVTYTTRHLAERKMAEKFLGQLQQFLSGVETFNDAMTIDEFIVEVTVYPDGSVADEEGNYFTDSNWAISR